MILSWAGCSDVVVGVALVRMEVEDKDNSASVECYQLVSIMLVAAGEG